MKIKTLLFSLGFVLLLYCCSSEDVVKPPDPEPTDTTKPVITINDGLIPLAKGNYWKHEWTHWHGGKDTIVTKIDGDVFTNSDGMTYFYFKNESIHWLLRNKEDGYYDCGAILNADTIITSSLKFKYPVNPGEEWEYRIFSYDIYENKFSYMDTIKVTCIDTAADYSTVVGSFKAHCYHHKYNPDQGSNTGYEQDYYFYIKPNFGLLGVIQYGLGGNIKRSSKLIEYNIEGINEN